MALPALMRRGSLVRMNDPFRELERIQREIDRMFSSVLTEDSNETPVFLPPVDVEETDNHYVLSLDLPGVRKEDIRMEVMDNQLRVTGERKQEREDRRESSYRVERSYGTFERVFNLPSGVNPDQIHSEHENGVLRVAIPKAEAPKPRQLSIGEGKGGFFDRIVGKIKGEESQKNEVKPVQKQDKAA
jgi:HSP20 family protein